MSFATVSERGMLATFVLFSGTRGGVITPNKDTMDLQIALENSFAIATTH